MSLACYEEWNAPFEDIIPLSNGQDLFITLNDAPDVDVNFRFGLMRPNGAFRIRFNVQAIGPAIGEKTVVNETVLSWRKLPDGSFADQPPVRSDEPTTILREQ
jgi:hypothetical protein